ncbi:n utilization substance protein B homolog [Mycoplasma sp. CAG:611]|jgi:transcription antitermination factor nusB|nr:transcription antitermination factor NusB [Mycoplasmatota bacterium]CDA23461.1 n utilization substance protein B homolog [Mycoplasma sp. CAG:611]
MKSRSELRDVIVTVTYQSYIMEVANLKFSIDKLIEEQPDIYKNEEFVIETCKGIYKNQKKISEMANKYLNNWTIDRLSKVDKAILSLGIYELLYTKTPSIVAINEAIELSKKYSDEDVTKMINACLDKIYHEELKEEK